MRVIGQIADFITQGFYLGNAVKAQEFAPFSRRLIPQLLEATHPAQCQISQQEKNRLNRIETLGRGEMALHVTQKTKAQQGSQGTKHATVWHIIGTLEARLGLFQGSECRSHPIHCSRSPNTHGRIPIGQTAFPLMAYGNVPLWPPGHNSCARHGHEQVRKK